MMDRLVHLQTIKTPGPDTALEIEAIETTKGFSIIKMSDAQCKTFNEFEKYLLLILYKGDNKTAVVILGHYGSNSITKLTTIDSAAAYAAFWGVCALMTDFTPVIYVYDRLVSLYHGSPTPPASVTGDNHSSGTFAAAVSVTQLRRVQTFMASKRLVTKRAARGNDGNEPPPAE